MMRVFGLQNVMECTPADQEMHPYIRASVHPCIRASCCVATHCELSTCSLLYCAVTPAAVVSCKTTTWLRPLEWHL